jgi:glutamine synthetase
MSFNPHNSQDLSAAAQKIGAHTVECALADFSSVARGKRLNVDDWVSQLGCKLPTVLLGMGITGGAPAQVFGDLLPKAYADMQLVPDLDTLVPRPGRPGEATVLCDSHGSWWAPALGREVDASEFSPRAVLKKVLKAYAAQGLSAKVAPELEVFFLQPEPDGKAVSSARAQPGSPARESSCEQYSLERMTHFDPFFDELYAACEICGIALSGHLHEAAFSQFEVNFRPAEPLRQADAVFRFKRLAREIAARHGFLASFVAKPFLDQPGTGMHWHFSVQKTDAASSAWPHLFATPEGQPSAQLLHFIAGLQAHTPAAMALLAPFDMSFDRITLSDSSPTHADWAFDDRHAAFRIPASSPQAVRVENRLPGGDASPYLIVAATLALGLAGLQAQRLPLQGKQDVNRLPRNLPDALDALEGSQAIRELLGSPMVDLFVALKRHEHAERQACANPRQDWDMKHLIELS